MKTSSFAKFRILTRDWQRGLRPWRAGRRWAIIVWTALMLLLSVWWAFSWLGDEQVTAWEHGIERWWEPGGGTLDWWQLGDLPFHVGTSFVMVLVLELGRWLLLPGWPRWTAPLVAVVIAVSDECLQGLSKTRHFDLRDLGNDAAGMLLAILMIVVAVFLIRRAKTDSGF